MRSTWARVSAGAAVLGRFSAIARLYARVMGGAALQTVGLRDDANQLEALFVPGAGMLCCSLRHRDQELLSQNAGVTAYAQQGKTMGIPLLYPWANRLAGFDWSLGGRVAPVRVPRDQSRVRLDTRGLPIHGVIGGRLAWALTDEPDRDANALSARLSWSDADPQLFEVFPFRHELHYRAQLDGGRLEVELAVHACRGDAVPLSFGFHPYLTLPGVPREQWLVELPAMRALALDAQQIPTGAGQALAPQRFELERRELDDGFDSVAEPARFSVAGGGRRIELTFVQGYPCAQVFAPSAPQCVCFEPMTAPTNALRSGEGLRLLEAGERFVASFAVAVADFG
ncbi:MAG TPA: aldose 1-epimerase [Solirubrobacteraceae bacterium]|nr:aldose 1-epimerase [Solirubrobacteraceae bacterium]